MADNTLFDEEIEEVAEYDTDTLEDLEEERCLEIIDEFKAEIRNNPTFYGIDYISSYQILCLTECDHAFTKCILDQEQLDMFDKMFFSIYWYSTTESNYNFIASRIFKKIYIN